jgi:hypothetical protein
VPDGFSASTLVVLRFSNGSVTLVPDARSTCKGAAAEWRTVRAAAAARLRHPVAHGAEQQVVVQQQRAAPVRRAKQRGELEVGHGACVPNLLTTPSFSATDSSQRLRCA